MVVPHHYDHRSFAVTLNSPPLFLLHIFIFTYFTQLFDTYPLTSRSFAHTDVSNCCVKLAYLTPSHFIDFTFVSVLLFFLFRCLFALS